MFDAAGAGVSAIGHDSRGLSGRDSADNALVNTEPSPDVDSTGLSVESADERGREMASRSVDSSTDDNRKSASDTGSSDDCALGTGVLVSNGGQDGDLGRVTTYSGR